MADAGSNLGKLTPKYDFSQYRYREIASRSLTKKSNFVNFLGKNCHFGNFPKAATGFNFGLLTIRFRVQLSWNLNFWAQEVSEAL